MNPSAFASIMIIVVFLFVGGMVYIYKRHQVEPEEKTVEKDQLNNLDLTLEQISQKRVSNQEQKQQSEKDQQENVAKDDKKKQEEIRIKNAQEKNRMKKTPIDEYLEKIKLAESDLLKKKF